MAWLNGGAKEPSVEGPRDGAGRSRTGGSGCAGDRSSPGPSRTWRPAAAGGGRRAPERRGRLGSEGEARERQKTPRLKTPRPRPSPARRPPTGWAARARHGEESRTDPGAGRSHHGSVETERGEDLGPEEETGGSEEELREATAALFVGAEGPLVAGDRHSDQSRRLGDRPGEVVGQSVEALVPGHRGAARGGENRRGGKQQQDETEVSTEEGVFRHRISFSREGSGGSRPPRLLRRGRLLGLGGRCLGR